MKDTDTDPRKAKLWFQFEGDLVEFIRNDPVIADTMIEAAKCIIVTVLKAKHIVAGGTLE